MRGWYRNVWLFVLLALFLSGCLETSGIASPPRRLGGTVSGLSGTLTLFAVGSIVAVSDEGTFVFPEQFSAGTAYTVVVLSEPPGHDCAIENASGIMGTQDITNVKVTCLQQTLFSVGGTIKGLSGELILKNGTDSVTVIGDGEFAFPMLLEDGMPYAVEVYQAPLNQSCSVVNGTGVIAGAEVSNLLVTCVADDPRLLDLVISEGTLSPAFAAETILYFTQVPLLVPSISVIPTAANPDSLIFVNGEVVPSGQTSLPIMLDVGSSLINVQVKSPGGAMRDYGVLVDREEKLEATYFKASNSASVDYFGAAVAISGDILVVGAPGEDSGALGINGDQGDNSEIGSGAVYVFVRDGDSWKQEAYIKASNADSGDQFGVSVAIDGNTLVVGAPGEDSNAKGIGGQQSDEAGTNSGAVYVFVRDNGMWSQQAYIKASNTGSFDVFGSSVAISGDTLAVGAPSEDSNAKGIGGDENNNNDGDSGAVYVFARMGTTWMQQAYLKASNTDGGDGFGAAIALFGDRLAVGATDEDSNALGVNPEPNEGAFEAGAVYVFLRENSVWKQEAFVKASNAASGDRFGASVALSADTLVVGARNEDGSAVGVDGDQTSNGAIDSGAAYVFRWKEGMWAQEAYLKASNSDNYDSFGASLALSGDTLAVAAHGENSPGTGLNGEQFENTASDSGAVYLFTRSGAKWSPLGYLKPPNTDSGDEFGKSVALSASTLVCSQHLDDSDGVGLSGNPYNNALGDSGAVFVFR